MDDLPDGVTVHVLPTGGSAAPSFNDIPGQFRSRSPSRVPEQIDSAHRATAGYLSGTTE
jgi:hypothetical protein